MKQTETRQAGGWQAFYYLIKETRPSKLLLAIALFMSVATTLVGLAIPLGTSRLVDSFSISTISASQIVLLAAAFLAQAIALGLSTYMLNHVGQNIVASLRDRLWKKLLSLPVSYYDNHQTGETISRMTNDTGLVKQLITEHLSNFLSGVISITGSIVVLFYLDWRMTLIMLTAVPVALGILFPLGRRMRLIARGLQDETAKLSAVLTQVLSEIRLVKSSNAEEREYGNGKKGIAALLHFGLKESKIQAMISPIVSFVLMMLLVVIIGYGGMRVSSGALTAGGLVAFILYLIQIIMPMGQLTMFFTQLQKTLGATERIVDILAVEAEDYGKGHEVQQAKQPIHVEHVTFAYENGEPILRDVSFTAQPGKVTAVVGPSGSGKTTLFSLLERYYQPSGGVIRLGANEISDFSLESWRRQIGYVSQESPIIAGTIRENICYGVDRPITDYELERAVEMAYAKGFIEDLPNKYETEVGERGIKLSGGQRQRIAIARALLRDPKILMLDEATSSLDSKSEIVVQKALKNLMKGRTTLVIAHRLSTIVDADQILFMEKGKITGSGTHEELFSTHAMYHEFATQQLRMKEHA